VQGSALAFHRVLPGKEERVTKSVYRPQYFKIFALNIETSLVTPKVNRAAIIKISSKDRERGREREREREREMLSLLRRKNLI